MVESKEECESLGLEWVDGYETHKGKIVRSFCRKPRKKFLRFEKFIKFLKQSFKPRLTKEDMAGTSVAGIEMIGGIVMILFGIIMIIDGIITYTKVTTGFFGFFGNFNPSWIVPVVAGIIFVALGMSILGMSQNSKIEADNANEREV